SAVPGAAYYKLVAIDEASPDSVALEALKLTGTSFTPSTPLLVGHAYSWYVQGFVTPWGVETAGAPSTRGRLHVAPVGAPSLGAPANGATVTTLTPTLQWTAVPGATRYRVTVIDTTLGTDPQAVYEVSGTSVTLSPSLINGHHYQWYVQGFDNVG